VVDKDLGFSLWLDFVEREYLQNAFGALIEQGVINGATSNPAIFASAISSSPAYTTQLQQLEGRSAKEKYEALAIVDIRTAAQALRGCYDSGNDGYISIEVDPFLSDDTEATVAEGVRLYGEIGEPNVMIKVPATEAGYAAMTALMAQGISVNATLIFSPAQAERCVIAMREGIAQSNRRVEGVVSVFVSRFDRLLDEKLSAAGVAPSKVGIYNAAKIYSMIEEAALPEVRTLFASTGVKGETLRADYYIRALLAPHSVNTAPLMTIESYIQSPLSVASLPIASEEIDRYFAEVAAAGIEMERVYSQLLQDGLKAFEEAFAQMLERIA